MDTVFFMDISLLHTFNNFSIFHVDGIEVLMAVNIKSTVFCLIKVIVIVILFTLN